MSDITVQLIPDHEPLPINDDPLKDYGELNYIFYPCISQYKEILLTNPTASNIDVKLKFKENGVDNIWWRTMRLSELPGSGIWPSGISEQEWSGTITASGTQTLYVYSDVTKEGWSRQYDGTYWTNSGFTIADLNLINDKNEVTPAIDCDSANAASTLTLDLGVNNTEAFHRVKFSVDAHVHLICNIQYSDNGSAWTTVYTGADLSICNNKKAVTFWWPDIGAHRYWRIYKTNAATAGGNITNVQWLLFEAHKNAYDYGVYGDHKCYLYDANNNMDDFEWKTSVMVTIDIFNRQNYFKPIGRINKRTSLIKYNLDKYGQDVQLWYIPTVTFSYGLDGRSDYQLEARVWNTRGIITPSKRFMRYTAAGDGLAPSMYRYDQREIYFSPFGPDFVGWYMVNYDFWHQYGHSYYIIWDNKIYKVDDPQPIYLDNEVLAIHARLFLDSDVLNLTTDPRNYVLSNKDGIFAQHPNAMQARPDGFQSLITPDQRPARWAGAYPTYSYTRSMSLLSRPNPYELADEIGSDTWPTGEAYETEEWLNPTDSNFQTTTSPAFAALVKSSAGDGYFQMARYYNWIGYFETSGYVDPVSCIIQLYYDEECLIPVTFNLQSSSTTPKVETIFAETNISAGTYLVTLTALGNYILVDGHKVKTPSKLYVRYRAENDESTYYATP